VSSRHEKQMEIGMNGTIRRSILLALVALPVEFAVAKDDQEEVVIFNAPGGFQRLKEIPGEPQPPQTGEIRDTGLLSCTMVTLPGDETLLHSKAPELRVIRHTDRFQSRTLSHVDSVGLTQPDTFDVVITVVLMPSTENNARVTFIGPVSAGTGIFHGATGVVSGYAAQVAPKDAAVAYAFEGEMGGEIHFRPGALHGHDND
jgi:hypothetical protein